MTTDFDDPEFERDIALERRALPQVRVILGQVLGPDMVTPASLEQDVKAATDMVAPETDSRAIAVRGRRYGFFELYRYDFTIRSWRKSGAKTEYQKINEGCGRFLFYFHLDKDYQIAHWLLGDLDIFRQSKVDGFFQKNKDGKTGFRVFRTYDFPSSFIVASNFIKHRRPEPAPVTAKICVCGHSASSHDRKGFCGYCDCSRVR